MSFLRWNILNFPQFHGSLSVRLYKSFRDPLVYNDNFIQNKNVQSKGGTTKKKGESKPQNERDLLKPLINVQDVLKNLKNSEIFSEMREELITRLEKKHKKDV